MIPAAFLAAFSIAHRGGSRGKSRRVTLQCLGMKSSYLQIAIETARDAGRILLEEFSRSPDITYKGDVDLVTQGDKRSEALIVSRLKKLFPQHTIVAEEGTGQKMESRFAWHIDPLDGTTNFAHGYPCFSVSIALAEADTLLAGVVYNPVSSELFAAGRGEGATLNGRLIRVSKIPELARSLVCTGFPTHLRTNSLNIHYYWDFTLRSHGVRRDGSAALDLASVAAGRFEGFWEFGLNSWDTAAGVLLVHEAGGCVTDLEGKPYRPGGPSILASNGLVHDEMLRIAADIARRDPNAPFPR